MNAFVSRLAQLYLRIFATAATAFSVADVSSAVERDSARPIVDANTETASGI